jgi:hypothetical protein
MGLITRQIGPDAKGSKLTFVEMDENLYYLQSLGVSGLTFSNNTLSLINPTGGTLTVSINAGSTFTGGTVTGSTIFTNGLTANTLTVNGVSITGDTYTTGGTYSNGTIDFYYNTGGGYQVDVTGLTDNDIYVTGFTYQNNTFTISDNSGSTFNATINTVTGLTINGNETINNGKLTINQNNGVVGVDVVNSTEAMVQVQNSPTELSIFGRFTGETYIYSSLLVPIVFYTNGNNKRMVIDSIGNVGVGTTSPLTKLHVSGNTLINGSLTATTISATTYQNLPTDIRVTGGTYSAGTITFINNTGGTFNVTGITKTLNNEWLIASGTTVEIESFTQKFLYGDLYVSGLLQLNENSQLVILNGDLILSGGTISGSGQTTLVDLPTVNDLISSGTYSAGTLTLSTLNGSDVFISGFYTGTTQFTNGLTANTISATTYQNLPDNVTGKYLPLSGGTVTGSTFFTNGLTANTISATTLQSSNTYIESTGYLYFGNDNTNGSWRMRISGPNFIVEKRVSGNWIISGTFN